MKKTVLTLSLIAGIAAIAALSLLAYYLGVTAGVKLDPEKLTLDTSCVQIFDTEGLAVETASPKRAAALKSLPSYLPSAFVAVEDKRFYSHGGLDYKRISKAFLKNLASFSFREGASTISQQLIKNTHLTNEKTVTRKLKEFKLTRLLERRYTKDEILELYLNSIYFGHNAFGIENAAEFYFGKEAAKLDPAESATLAALVKSPNRYSPFRNAEKCLSRRNFVLSLMRDQGYLSVEEYENALREKLPESPAPAVDTGSAYFSLLFDELSELFPDAKAGELQNLRVFSYYDAALQTKLEETEAETDVCLLVRDNKTQGLKALYSTAGTPKRLPASTIKPLLVYAPALEENFIAPATPVLDEKTDFGGYSPSNYGGKCEGYVSARYALAHSLNIPAVKTLNVVGVERACGYLEKMNLTVEREDHTLALALGGMKHGFSLPELADAYATFANEGYFCPSRTIARVENAQGKELYRYIPEKRRVFSEDVSFLINDMLQTAVTDGTAKKLRSLGFPVCAKTGTGANGEGNTDAYTVSYTREDTVAVWMGMKDNSTIPVTGGGLPANLALKINSYLYSNGAPEPFPGCDGVEKVSFDREEYLSNHRILRSDPASPPITQESDYFRKCALPNEISSRFSSPTIAMPNISVKNGSVCIELCQTEYYEYIVKRKNGRETVTIYSGKYRPQIYDNSVKGGESYEYFVIPVYNGNEGEAVALPSVRIDANNTVPDDWWE